jgi:hypothetical protein
VKSVYQNPVKPGRAKLMQAGVVIILMRFGVASLDLGL